MKIRISTEYSNVDEEFLSWWLKNNAPNYGIPNDIDIEDVPFKHVLENKDPTSEIRGTTVIEVIK